MRAVRGLTAETAERVLSLSLELQLKKVRTSGAQGGRGGAGHA